MLGGRQSQPHRALDRSCWLLPHGDWAEGGKRQCGMIRKEGKAL